MPFNSIILKKNLYIKVFPLVVLHSKVTCIYEMSSRAKNESYISEKTEFLIIAKKH